LFLLVLLRIGQAHERWGKYLSQIDTSYQFHSSRGLTELSHGPRERRRPLIYSTFTVRRKSSSRLKISAAGWENRPRRNGGRKPSILEGDSSRAGPIPLESRQIYSAKTWQMMRIVEVEYHGGDSSRLENDGGVLRCGTKRCEGSHFMSLRRRK
jgi:hypothetical protein